MIPEHPNDRDYFYDVEENVYQVIGYVHPKDYVYCLQKYEKIPKDEAIKQDYFTWKSKITNLFYKRNISTYSSKSATSIIHQNKYKALSSLYGTEFIHFPKSEIKTYLNPIEKLRDLRTHIKSTFLSLTDQERTAIELSHLIEQELGIDSEFMGVTGSILWGGVHSQSDIDLVIYGIQNVQRFLQGIEKLLQANARFRLPSLTEQISWAGKFSQKSGMPLEDCTVSIARKKFLLFFSKFFISMAFNPTGHEIIHNTLANPQTQFHNVPKLHSVTIKATVTQDQWMYYYPGVIYIENVAVLDPDPSSVKIPPICRVVVFEHENIGYYSRGTDIEIRGLAQIISHPPQDVIQICSSKVESTNAFAQIIVGTFENYGNEYIRNLRI